MEKANWISVKQASGICIQNQLPRSLKSIRRWCANGDIEAEKRPNGRTEQWFINRESLEIKIKEELEFLKQSERSFPQPENLTEHRPDMIGRDRSQADVSAHEHSQADTSGQAGKQRPDVSGTKHIEKLQDEIMSLKVDVAVKSEQAKQFQKLFLEGQKTIQAQSRYIGHVETKILNMGGTTDQSFLEAPVPKSGLSADADNQVEVINPEIVQGDQVHPNQRDFYSG